MRKFFGKIKDWFKRHRPSKRRLIQVYSALLYNANLKGYITGNIYTGNSKLMCVPGLNCYSCPGAVGACPLGALQNALAQSGTRAPFYVLGILALLGLILGRTVCGFLCPAGLGQELLYKIKTPKLKKSKFTRIFSYLKYVILVVLVIALPLMFGLAGKGGVPAFCKYICPAGTFGGAFGLLANPSNAGLFNLLGSLFTWKFAVLCVICVACVFIFRFFCRFFCPLGAIYGFFSKIALLGVKLDKNKCTDCGLCVDVCKMDIKHVGDHECIHCGACISVCPTKAIRWKGSKLFVHANAVEAGASAEAKPLNAFLGANGEAGDGAVAASVAEETQPVAIATETAVSETVDPVEVMIRRERKRNFWLEFSAWAAALVLLVWSLVYFNFIKKDAVAEGMRIGEICPDFTV
ncbi:MAG: 4Fe-4S binding protein, partial [Clostridia bacterium]|nr:4Fe-4S binding protein [Clostridia bacterium]